MSTSRILATDLQGGIGARFDISHNRVIVAEFDGIISSSPMSGEGRTVLGTGYAELEDLVLTGDGLGAFVSERGGSLLKVNLDDANRASASLVTSGMIAPHQIVLFESADIAWVIEYNIMGRLLEIDLSTGIQKVLASGFENAVGLVARADRSLALVSEQATTGGRITAVELPSGARTVAA